MTDLLKSFTANTGKDVSELGVQTGFVTLDNLFQFSPGQMVVIGSVLALVRLLCSQHGL